MSYRQDVPLTDRDGNVTYPRTTAESVHLGDTTLEKMLSNRNLLDNWYFMNPINQKGQTSYSGTMYGIDMWLVAPAEGVVAITANGLTLSVGARIAQKMETPPNGQKVTLSILVNNSLITTTWIWDASAGYTVLTMADGWRLAYQPTNTNLIQIYNYGGHADDLLKAAKLELGPVQTLAHQENGEWVLNDPPPNPATELAKCQRYQRPIGMQRILAFAANANLLGFFVPLGDMRDTPSITLDSSKISVLPVGNSTALTGFTYSVTWVERTGFRINATKTNHGITDYSSVYLSAAKDFAFADANL